MSYVRLSNLGCSDFSNLALSDIRLPRSSVMAFASPNFVLAPLQLEGVHPDVPSDAFEEQQAVFSLDFVDEVEQHAACAITLLPSSKAIARLKIVIDFFNEFFIFILF